MGNLCSLHTCPTHNCTCPNVSVEHCKQGATRRNPRVTCYIHHCGFWKLNISGLLRFFNWNLFRRAYMCKIAGTSLFRTSHTVRFFCDLNFSCSTSQMFLSHNQGSYASWKPLNFKSPFSRPWKSLKFSFVHFGPWILIEEHWLRIIVTFTVLFITEGNFLISTHKGIFIKMVAVRKKGPLLSEYCYSLFGTFRKSNK